MEAAFGAVYASIKFLNLMLSSEHEQIVHSLCQQCEASLQFLQLLCQQKLFRERLLRNKVSESLIFNFRAKSYFRGVLFLLALSL